MGEIVIPDAEWDTAWIAACKECEDGVGHVICGAPTSNGMPCRKRPTRGQVRCMDHLRAAHLQTGDHSKAGVPVTQIAVIEDTDRGIVERWRSTFEERMPPELRLHFEVMHDRTITTEMMMRELIAVQRSRLHMALSGEAEIGVLDPQVSTEVSLLGRLVNDLNKVSASASSHENDSILALARMAFTAEADADELVQRAVDYSEEE